MLVLFIWKFCGSGSAKMEGAQSVFPADYD